LVKVSVNRFVSRRIETTRKEVKADTQKLRKRALENLEEIFRVAARIAEGEIRRQRSDGKITSTIALAEICAKTLKTENQELAEKQRTFIKEKRAISPLDEAIAMESAKIDVIMKKKITGWGLAGSIVYATGTAKKAKIVTGDDTSRNWKM
jgi:PIN domain nuclease of toxin-antitoxin system